MTLLCLRSPSSKERKDEPEGEGGSERGPLAEDLREGFLSSEGRSEKLRKKFEMACGIARVLKVLQYLGSG